MSECKVGGDIGKYCREGAYGNCWLLWSVRDGDPDEGGENDLESAKRHGKRTGILGARTHIESISKGWAGNGCPNREEALAVVREYLRQIEAM